MISPAPGVMFTTAADGDMRRQPAYMTRLRVVGDWATVRQVHGSKVVEVERPGDHGEADGLFTDVPGLPLAVFTADCLGIVLRGPSEVAVVHAGWRGLASGVIERAVGMLGEVDSVFIGPHIRECCFEVGPEVAELFEGHLGRTTAGTVSVDLAGAAAARLPLQPEVVDLCTKCGADTFSHRLNATDARMATVGWIP
ncbi:MAG: polyphenol oxidase family protein [Acidimicrobiia bacterium]